MDREIVDRPELTEPLVSSLCADDQRTFALTAALHGTGGFGKTTIAIQMCGRPEIARKFKGGLLWVTIGEKTGSAELAAKISDLCAHITGDRPSFSDAEQAGFRLGQILDDIPEPVLLVVDDVWEISQVRPFLLGGGRCTRLITTRRKLAVPDNAKMVVVEKMRPSQANELLTRGIADQIPDELTFEIQAKTGGWPVLLDLANRALGRLQRGGASTIEAANHVLTRLNQAGPGALDLANPTERRHAVAATLRASLDLLPEDQRERYYELAIFAEDAPVPRAILEIYWGAIARMSPVGVEQFCDELFDLSLVLSHRYNPPSVVLHDVLRSYVRNALGKQNVRDANRNLLAAIASVLDIDRGATREWCKLPRQLTYLFRNLSYHLTEAELVDELNSLLVDLRWTVAQLELGGPSAVEADLAKGTTPTVQALARAIGQMSHMLAPVTPRRSIESIVASRLAYNVELNPIVKKFSDQLTGTRLVNLRSLPDNPDPALWRTFAAPQDMVNAIVFAPDSSWIAAAGVDSDDNGVIQVWDTHSGELIHEIRDASIYAVQALVVSESGKRIAFAHSVQEVRLVDIFTKQCRVIHEPAKYPIPTVGISSDGTWITAVDHDNKITAFRVGYPNEPWNTPIQHSAKISCVTISPDGGKVVSGDAAGGVRIWSVGEPRAERLLARHASKVCVIGIAPDGSWAVTGDESGQLWIWDLASRRVARELDQHRGEPQSLVVEPDGKWIATADREYGVNLWDTETGGQLGHLDTLSVSVMNVTQNGRWLATGSSRDQALRLWDVDRTIADACLQRVPKSSCTAVDAAHDGTWVAIGYADRAVHIVDIQSGETREIAGVRFRGNAYFDSLAISPDDSLLIVPGRPELGIVYQLDVKSNELERINLGYASSVESLMLGSDGALLVSESTAGDVYFTDLETRETRLIYSSVTSELTAVQISPDGRWLAVADGGDVLVADLRTGSIDAVLNHGRETVWAIAVSLDLGIVATYTGAGILRIWESGRVLLAEIQTGDIAECLAQSSNGRYLAAGGGNGGIFVVDMTTMKLVATMRVDGTVLDCVWLPGRLVLCVVGSRGAYYFELVEVATL